ncbi:MAG: hypothetical protein GY797_12625 [Deltaproteobacteria bacterium]|nr:hypothetical protein [Deltaproteobacteria bacterium]
MIKSGKRQNGNPIILRPNGETIRPERISFTQKIFDEGWLQELIHTNPELLPADEIEPIYSPLVSIGKEVSTKVGSIDNLYISPQERVA